MTDLKGKTVLITGANAGIGKEVARQLALRPETARIYLACRNRERATAAKAELEAKTGRAIFEGTGTGAGNGIGAQADLAILHPMSVAGILPDWHLGSAIFAATNQMMADRWLDSGTYADRSGGIRPLASRLRTPRPVRQPPLGPGPRAFFPAVAYPGAGNP